MNYKIKKGNGILKNIREILREYDVYIDDTIVFYGHNISREIFHRYFKGFKGLEITGGNIQEKDSIKSFMDGFGFIIGVGGGKILDTVKLAAGELGKIFISIPSTLSNDGIFSPVSVLFDGKEVKSIITEPPDMIIIDFEIVMNSPLELLLSGIGDLVSNISALKDWELSEKNGKSLINRDAYNISLEGAKKILFTNKEPFSLEFIQDLATGLIDSGIAMRITRNSKPASGAEHLISHALDIILKEPKRHGIQCGFATIFTLNLHNDLKDLKEILNLYEKVNFPKKFIDMGLTPDDFLRAVSIAPETRKGRYTILDETEEKEWIKKITIYF